MPIVVRKLRVKEEYIMLLNAMCHKEAGEIADNLGVQPAVVRSHIKNNTPTLLRADWKEQIMDVLCLSSDINIYETIPEE